MKSLTSYVYALVDPHTHLVRYVGQTGQLETRYNMHCFGNGCTKEWVKSLAPLKPILLILAEVIHPDFDSYPATVEETKWIKRFRRTILNARQRQNSPSTWDKLVNPDERTKE